VPLVPPVDPVEAGEGLVPLVPPVDPVEAGEELVVLVAPLAAAFAPLAEPCAAVVALASGVEGSVAVPDVIMPAVVEEPVAAGLEDPAAIEAELLEPLPPPPEQLDAKRALAPRRP
jgi:hypothetical protein